MLELLERRLRIVIGFLGDAKTFVGGAFGGFGDLFRPFPDLPRDFGNLLDGGVGIRCELPRRTGGRFSHLDHDLTDGLGGIRELAFGVGKGFGDQSDDAARLAGFPLGLLALLDDLFDLFGGAFATLGRFC